MADLTDFQREILKAVVTLPAAVQPKSDDDALLIDNLFRATLGGDSMAIDAARMALRQRMNELRTAGVPVAPALAGLADYLRQAAVVSLNNCDRSGVDEGTRRHVEKVRAWADEVDSIACGASVAPKLPTAGLYHFPNDGQLWRTSPLIGVPAGAEGLYTAEQVRALLANQSGVQSSSEPGQRCVVRKAAGSQPSAECPNVKGNPRDGYYCDECGSGPCTSGANTVDEGKAG